MDSESTRCSAGTKGRPEGERASNSSGEPKLEGSSGSCPWRMFRPRGRSDEGQGLAGKGAASVNIIIRL